MSRKFIVLIAGSAIALTTLTAPARAGEHDAARALALILGLAVVGKIISDKKDDREVARAHRPHQHGLQPRPLPRRARDHKLLPQKCFRTFQTPRREVRGLGARCLDRNYAHTHLLPKHCAVQVQTLRGWGWAYRARCLREKGYRLAQR